MTETEDQLRNLLRRAVPPLGSVSPDVLDARRSKVRIRLAVASGAAVIVVGVLVLALAVFTEGSDKRRHAAGTDRPSSSSPPTVGQVTGTLLISPPFAHEYPTSGTIEISGARTRRVVVGADGRFAVSLAPGTYVLVGHAPTYDDNRGACIVASGPTVVQPGHTVRVTIVCLEK